MIDSVETINQDIKYSFNQFELALIGFVSYLQLRLQQFIPNLPVFIQNSGDFSYFVNKKFVETKNEEIIQKIPRFVIKIDDIQPNSTENTNQYNKIFYKFDGHIYQAVVRRLCYNITIIANFVSSNLITALNHIEMMATFAARDNVYTYDFLGNTCQAAFNITGNNNEFPSIDMGQGGTRNVSVSNSIELQVHILVPRIESIILADDAKIDRFEYNIVQKGYDNKLYLIKPKSEDELDENESNKNDEYDFMKPPEDFGQKDESTVIETKDCDCPESPRIIYKAGQKLPRNINFK